LTTSEARQPERPPATPCKDGETGDETEGGREGGRGGRQRMEEWRGSWEKPGGRTPVTGRTLWAVNSNATMTAEVVSSPVKAASSPLMTHRMDARDAARPFCSFVNLDRDCLGAMSPRSAPPRRRCSSVPRAADGRQRRTAACHCCIPRKPDDKLEDAAAPPSRLAPRSS
jgi:hypothetical protein